MLYLKSCDQINTEYNVPKIVKFCTEIQIINACYCKINKTFPVYQLVFKVNTESGVKHPKKSNRGK